MHKRFLRVLERCSNLPGRQQGLCKHLEIESLKFHKEYPVLPNLRENAFPIT